MESRGLEFTVEIDAEPLWVDGDPARLQQIQVNLLNNAAKYTPRGGHVMLEVDARGRRRGASACATTASASRRTCSRRVFDLFVQSKPHARSRRRAGSASA